MHESETRAIVTEWRERLAEATLLARRRQASNPVHAPVRMEYSEAYSASQGWAVSCPPGGIEG